MIWSNSPKSRLIYNNFGGNIISTSDILTSSAVSGYIRYRQYGRHEVPNTGIKKLYAKLSKLCVGEYRS